MGLEGSSAGQWWLEMIGKTLDEGSTFSRVGSRQLAGLLISVWLVFLYYAFDVYTFPSDPRFLPLESKPDLPFETVLTIGVQTKPIIACQT